MHQWTERAQEEARAKVFSMAANDPAFRALALRDGRAAVEKATGMRLPQGFNVRFVDPAGAHLTAVLPLAAYEEQELDEFELMAVAGGKGGSRKRSSPDSSGDADDPNALTVSNVKFRD
jgi:hypothetical protein